MVIWRMVYGILLPTWLGPTVQSGHCPDLQRRFCAALQHFASAALIAQQLPFLEPGCCKAMERVFCRGKCGLGSGPLYPLVIEHSCHSYIESGHL